MRQDIDVEKTLNIRVHAFNHFPARISMPKNIVLSSATMEPEEKPTILKTIFIS